MLSSRTTVVYIILKTTELSGTASTVVDINLVTCKSDPMHLSLV